MRERKDDWRDLFFSFQIARSPSKIFVIFLALIASIVWVTLVLGVNSWIDQNSGPTTLRIFVNCVWSPTPDNIKTVYRAATDSLLVPEGVGFSGFLTSAAEWFAAIITLLVLVLIWSIAAGICTRAAALEYAKDDFIELSEMKKYTMKRLSSYFLAPIGPFLLILGFAACIVVTALIFGRALSAIPGIGWIIGGLADLCMALGMPLAFLAGAFIALLLLGLVGIGMMAPTISVESSDAFDAASRLYSYVYSKPWRFLFYKLVSLVYGAACFAFVIAVVWIMLHSSFYLAEYGRGPDFKIVKDYALQIQHIDAAGQKTPVPTIQEVTKIGRHFAIMAVILRLWVDVIWAAVLSFAISFLMVACTITYFLMRKNVDNIEVKEIFEEEEEKEEEVKPSATTAEEEKKPEGEEEKKEEEKKEEGEEASGEKSESTEEPSTTEEAEKKEEAEQKEEESSGESGESSEGEH